MKDKVFHSGVTSELQILISNSILVYHASLIVLQYVIVGYCIPVAQNKLYLAVKNNQLLRMVLVVKWLAHDQEV